MIIDDRRDQFEAVLTDYFKREGQMEGGEFMNLAVESAECSHLTVGTRN